MARPIKISRGDLFSRGKTKVVCVTGIRSSTVHYIEVKGRYKGEDGIIDTEIFLDFYPNRVDRIVIE